MEELLELTNVSVKYRLTAEAPKTLQEVIVRRLKGKKAQFKDFWALRNVSLSLSKGAKLGIIGVNGSGKSTLLKVIAGIIKPTEGEARVNGIIAPLIELGAGFDFELTGTENVYLNGSILGLSRKQIDSKMDNILEFSGLGPFIHAPLRSYSSGMIARLAFSIAVEVNADILIVDEVLSVGDEGFRKKCREKIDEIIAAGTNLLFVSHSLADVQRLCNTALWLDKGRVVEFGDADRICRRYLVYFDETVFADIPQEHPSREAIDAMFMHGVTNGYEVNGRRVFNPDNSVSRAELAVFLSRVLKLEMPHSLTGGPFKDVSSSHWAAGSIAALHDCGLVAGTSDGEGNRFFFPHDYVRASDLAEILSRIDEEKLRATLPVVSDELLTRGATAEIFYRFFSLSNDQNIVGGECHGASA
ncbi:ATP-binding cassette domain-containing protein [Desulfoferrobacter suflitae]|uniref:ATP-binding cassette domain-containing protein n=1 Tax=Desulfoferrobacter suflitae TaxID=2865782 RepID=UPI00216414BE|nr:ATP-binding cassette domain-containing protein [Desulfoferrobacter suflitae]MCK8602168.1 ATP-binding cassette domain-containing protein [Desulfoferrobacter suflitae]